MHETKLTPVTNEGKGIHLTTNNFLALHVILIHINNRPHNWNKEEHNARKKSSMILTWLESPQVGQIVSIYSNAWLNYKLNNFVL